MLISYFFRKPTIINHPSVIFIDIPVTQTGSQKHLGIILDKKLNFEEPVNKVTRKINKTIGVIRKLQNVERRPAPFTIYKCFHLIHMNRESLFI